MDEEPSCEIAAPCGIDSDEMAVDHPSVLYPVHDDFQTDARRQAAADALMHYSQTAMICVGRGVQPSHVRFHLIKEISGIKTTWDRRATPDVASTSARAMRTDGTSLS